MAVLALLLSLLALLVSGVGVWAAVVAWRDRGRYRALAERIDVDARIEYLTTQTLGAMRAAARQRPDW